MRRAIRVLLVFLAATVLLIGAEGLRERFTRRPFDLRTFDAAAVGKLDTDMWRSYYERRPVRLFEQMITLLRTQYGMRPLQALMDAYHAAHAAFVFKDGRSRAGYEKALPDLEAYYRDIDALPDALAALQAEIYGVPAERFAEHARLRAQAMDLRDGKGSAITEADWQRIGEMLAASWNSLYNAVNAGY